jgi:mono/diheme cytochrome c family protein
MTHNINAALGVTFLVLAVVAAALMFQFWGYPYDKDKRKSECPQWKMNIHRAVGLAYVAVYILLMIQMVPRLWQYQVEFPTRTVAHIMLGITIGFILILKISILRFWRHFEEWMPVLGTLLVLCTFLMLGLSLPFVFKERALVAAAPGGSAFSEQSQARVARLLPMAGLPEGTDLASLSAADALRNGREVLLTKCVQCHDLKTAISKPRTPSDWYRTVKRMADKPTLGDAIEVIEQHEVSAFLIAITPDLQTSAAEKRAGEMEQMKTRQALDAPAGELEGEAVAPDPAAARARYEMVCSQCHELSDVDENPPEDEEEIDDLVERMVDNGLEASAQDLDLVKWYLNDHFVNKQE